MLGAKHEELSQCSVRNLDLLAGCISISLDLGCWITCASGVVSYVEEAIRAQRPNVYLFVSDVS